MKDIDADAIRSQMINVLASFQMNWNAGGDEMVMYCWWKANNAVVIFVKLGEMAELFHIVVKEMPNVINVSD